MELRYYLLNEDHSLRQVPLMEWSNAFEVMDHTIAWSGNANKYVSTIFLGMDHSLFGEGPPIVFETMVFVNKGTYNEELDQIRYCSWAAAQAGHKRCVQKYLINQKTRVGVDI